MVKIKTTYVYDDETRNIEIMNQEQLSDWKLTDELPFMNDLDVEQSIKRFKKLFIASVDKNISDCMYSGLERQKRYEEEFTKQEIEIAAYNRCMGGFLKLLGDI